MVEELSSTGPTTGPLTDADYGDSVAGGGASIGYDFWYHFGVPIRVEGEFVHIVRLDADTRPIFSDGTLPAAGIENNISSRTLMVNTYFDWDFDTRFTPYFGFGIGYARNNSDASLNDFGTGLRQTVDTDKGNMAWSLMVGVQIDINDNWFADAGYRFVDAGELEAGPFANGVRLEAEDVSRHDLMLGVGYRF
jgi:opacity protein-like surface antigen